MGKDNTISIEQLLTEIEIEISQLRKNVTLWEKRFKYMPASIEVLAQNETKKLIIAYLTDWKERFQKMLL